MRKDSEEVRRLRRLWEEHIHRPFPVLGDDPSSQEVALYAAWLGSMVEAVLGRGALDTLHADMLRIRRAEGNRELFRAGGELGDPVRSYVARLIAIEHILISLPVDT
ncbi:MAG TPA: hypothetical protein VF956_03795 [Candidatus Dormibacteraeota bacterium]